MFNNIGGKIKALAQVLCWIGIACSVIYGFIMVEIFNHYDNIILFAFLFVAVGSLLSWVSSFLLYGFGQLIENTDILVSNAPKTHPNKTKQNKLVNNSYYTEDDFIRDMQIESQNKPKPQNFSEEIHQTSTSDLQLILQDQKNLYTTEELNIIKNELSARMK